MRDDLLDAQASVDWAVAQCDVLQKRIVDWIESGPYVAHTNKDVQTGEETWKVDESEPIPRLINAEAGSIINSIRSSLDLLANALAERNHHFGTKDVYFPVSRNSADFAQPKGSAYKKIKRLSSTDQAAIEKLQPYYGGDTALLLLALHDMDIERKHRRLINFSSAAHGVGVYRFGLHPDLDALYRQQSPEQGYVLARSSPHHPDYQIQVRIEVAFRNAGVVTGKEVIPTLGEFARLATAIIKLFDV